MDALQGQVSGLSIASASGDPSSTENDIRIRGLNSLNSSTTPLFILDGAPVTQTVFSTLNPNDIESITVLKDAASVALYGSRAANGVIVITSKKSKFGEQAKVNIRAKYGWSQMATDNIEMMDSYQYIKYRDMIGSPVSDAARYAVETLGINTDWKKKSTTTTHPHTLSRVQSVAVPSIPNTMYRSTTSIRKVSSTSLACVAKLCASASIPAPTNGSTSVFRPTSVTPSIRPTTNQATSMTLATHDIILPTPWPSHLAHCLTIRLTTILSMKMAQQTGLAKHSICTTHRCPLLLTSMKTVRLSATA